MRWKLVLVLTACGSDIAPTVIPPDVPPGTPVVELVAPARGQAFYVTQSAAIAWTVTDDSATTCDVTASADAPAIEIANGVSVPAGNTGQATWSLANVTPSSYLVRVVCRDPEGLAGSGESEPFEVSPAPQQVSFSAQVLPILTGNCTNSQCHDASSPQVGLELTAANAYAEIVGVPGKSCTSLDLVTPGAPNESYLMIKISGAGSCIVGTKMPKPPESLTASEIQRVRDWIANGAPDN